MTARPAPRPAPRPIYTARTGRVAYDLATARAQTPDLCIYHVDATGYTVLVYRPGDGDGVIAVRAIECQWLHGLTGDALQAAIDACPATPADWSAAGW